DAGALASAAPSSSTATTSGDLGAPTTVAATSTSSSAIRLAWTHVSNANGYEIDRSIDGVTWSAIASTDHGVTTYAHGGLSSGTTTTDATAAGSGAASEPAP